LGDQPRDAALAEMHADVHWPDMLPRAGVVGHDAVRVSWARQFEAIDPHVEPKSFSKSPNGDVVVDVCQTVRNKDTSLIGWLSQWRLGSLVVADADDRRRRYDGRQGNIFAGDRSTTRDGPGLHR
jgi:hypothetical protein